MNIKKPKNTKKPKNIKKIEKEFCDYCPSKSYKECYKDIDVCEGCDVVLNSHFKWNTPCKENYLRCDSCNNIEDRISSVCLCGNKLLYNDFKYHKTYGNICKGCNTNINKIVDDKLMIRNLKKDIAIINIDIENIYKITEITETEKKKLFKKFKKKLTVKMVELLKLELKYKNEEEDIDSDGI